jgi:hypothetical protein
MREVARSDAQDIRSAMVRLAGDSPSRTLTLILVMSAICWRRVVLVPSLCHLKSKNTRQEGAISSSVDAD